MLRVCARLGPQLRRRAGAPGAFVRVGSLRTSASAPRPVALWRRRVSVRTGVGDKGVSAGVWASGQQGDVALLGRPEAAGSRLVGPGADRHRFVPHESRRRQPSTTEQGRGESEPTSVSGRLARHRASSGSLLGAGSSLSAADSARTPPQRRRPTRTHSARLRQPLPAPEWKWAAGPPAPDMPPLPSRPSPVASWCRALGRRLAKPRRRAPHRPRGRRLQAFRRQGAPRRLETAGGQG